MFACLLSQFYGFFCWALSKSNVWSLPSNKRTEWFVRLLVLFVDGRCTLLLKCACPSSLYIPREYSRLRYSPTMQQWRKHSLILQFVYSSVILFFCFLFSIKWLYHSKLNTLSGPLCFFKAVICLWNYASILELVNLRMKTQSKWLKKYQFINDGHHFASQLLMQTLNFRNLMVERKKMIQSFFSKTIFFFPIESLKMFQRSDDIILHCIQWIVHTQNWQQSN